MDNNKLAELLFPHIDKTPEYYENLYPERNLGDGAKVTRLGPRPTRFVHLGNLYNAIIGERLAHQSGGVFYLRVEDTDAKREVEGAVELVLSAMDYFGIHFDEGVKMTVKTAHMHRIASVSERTYTNVLRKNSLKWVLRTLVSAAKKSFRKCAKHRCLKNLISDIMMNGLYAAILNMTRSKRR